MALAQKAYALASKTSDKKLLANATHAVAVAHFRLSNYEAAIDSLQKALILFNLVGDSAGIAKTYYTLGTCYIRKSDYVRAINFVEEVVKIATQFKDSSLLANAFNTLGIIYYTVENFPLSIEFFEKAQAFYEKTKSYKNLARMRGNISISLIKMGQFERAKEILTGTLTHYNNYMDSLILASHYDNMGFLYENIGKIDSALFYQKQSLQLSKAMNSSRGIALSNLALGRCCNQKKEWAGAKKYLEVAIGVAERTHEMDLVAQAHRQLSVCYEALGDYKNSLENVRSYLEYYDKTFTKQLVDQIAQLHTMLQVEKKERENQLLQGQLNLKTLNEQKDKKIITIYTIFSILLLGALGVIIFFAIQLAYRKKQLEESNQQLFQFNNELDALVKHRTVELNEALDKIRELERIKSAFLANISHEIRTPLNGILGLSYYLATPESAADERVQLGEQVKKLGNRLLRIVDDILELSKIETNQVNLLLSEFDLNTLLDEVEASFKSNEEFTAKNLFFLVNRLPVDKSSVIISDYNRLKSIVVHLLENAFKFTHKGGIEVGYSINNNSMLNLYVKDTGVGIPVEVQSRVFERFYRHQTEDSGIFYDGIGIGLTIAMGYALALGGNIRVRSAPGKGSTFTLMLPVTLPQNPGIPRQQVDFSGKRVLVVEDDLISYQYLHALLSKTGATVIHVKNAEDAIEVASIDHNLDLILLDIQLPFKSGIDAATEIRKTNKHTPIIIQTATDNVASIQSCHEAGCNAFLTKPIDPDELINLIKRLLEQQK